MEYFRRKNANEQPMSVALIMAVVLVMVAPVFACAQEIPSEFTSSLPQFIGSAARPHPLPPAQVPQNPFLAPSPFSNYHNDTWMSDTYGVAGPLGRDPVVWSKDVRTGNAGIVQCTNLSFDSYGRIVTVCVNLAEVRMLLVDPLSLEVIASMPLPPVNDSANALAAAYMILDNLDRAWVPTGSKITVVQETGDPEKTTFEIAREYDLSSIVPEKDHIGAVAPDFSGRMWFVTRTNGIVGVLDPATGRAEILKLGEEIANGFAVDNNDVYIVSVKKMYRFTAGGDNKPRKVWESEEYENVGHTKDGQYSPGSGTTPTILGHGEYVAIGDNGSQLHVMVYRTDERLGPNENRVVCKVPVFDNGLGAVEDSFVGSGRSIVLVNNYGAQMSPTGVSAPSEPGVARIDIMPNGKGCETVWTNTSATPATYGVKLSTTTGLLYLFTRKTEPFDLPDGTDKDVWYWTAIDFRTGETVWERLAGTGRLFDGYWPLMFMGPDGTAYMTTFGGITAIRDTR